MSCGVLLVTHSGLGPALLAIATGIYGVCPTRVDAVEVENDAPCDPLLAEALEKVARLDAGEGVLVLTDLYGSTPANLAAALVGRFPGARALAGVNLPMLVRALNYAELDLDALVEKALVGGRDGVLLCSPRGEEC